MLDFSFLFDDEEQGDDRVVPPPKKSKKDGFIMTLDEAIEAEIQAIKTAKSPCIVTVREVSEHVDLIKKFIGDYSRFESYNEREIEQVEEFFRERIRKCYSFHSDEHREFELSEEEMSWINMNYDTVVRIFYRTQAPVLHESQVWFGKSFLDISVELANLAKHEAFLKRVSLILSVPEDRAENMNSATSYDRDEIMALLREKGSAYGLTPKQVNENMNGFEDHLCKFVNAVNFEENGPIHDDREQFNAPNVALPLNNYPIKLDEDDGPVFEAPAPESNHEEGHLKSILKKTPGNHYSDRNVAKMSVEERVAYSKNYDILGSKKKTVSFSDAPECLVVFCKHSKSFIDAHKKKNGTGRAVWYPRQTTCFHVGERATTAIEISYEQYRVMTWEVENPLGVQRPATSFTNISNRDYRVRCFKDGIYKADDQDENGLEVPVHRYLVYPFAVPFIDQNALLEDHYSNLIKYSLFSQPSKSSATCSYNHSYGPMIITDSILEDANPYAVSNSGIFPFPYPLDELAVLGMLDELTPDQFFIRDIVFIWGFDKLMQNERSEDAVADLLTLYEMVKVKMLSKFEEYKRQGFSRLFKPRFWLSTFPETAALNMENFNDYIRAFVSHSSAIEETSSIPCRVDLIDWDQVCKEHQCPVSCKTAEDQLELLYKELEKKVDLVRRRDNAAKRLDIEKQLTRTNAMEWLANRIQKDRV